MSANAKIMPLAVKYAEVTNKALGAAVKMTQATQQEKKAALDKIPAVKDLLKRAKLVDEHELSTADNQLSKHAGAIDMLSSVITHYEGQLKAVRSKEASNNLGGPDSDSQSLPGRDKFANQPGYRRGDTDPHSEADLAYARGLGVELSKRG